MLSILFSFLCFLLLFHIYSPIKTSVALVHCGVYYFIHTQSYPVNTLVIVMKRNYKKSSIYVANKSRKLGQLPNTMHIFRLFQFSTVDSFYRSLCALCCFLGYRSLVYVYSSLNLLRTILYFFLFQLFFFRSLSISVCDFADDVHSFILLSFRYF